MKTQTSACVNVRCASSLSAVCFQQYEAEACSSLLWVRRDNGKSRLIMLLPSCVRMQLCDCAHHAAAQLLKPGNRPAKLPTERRVPQPDLLLVSRDDTRGFILPPIHTPDYRPASDLTSMKLSAAARSSG